MINTRFGQYYKGSLPSSSPSGGGAGAFLLPLAMSLVGGGVNAWQQSKQRKASIQMEREARAWNRQMWEDINEYNNPINQMARFQEAGLNPNLIYGSSPGQAAGNAGAIHPGKAPEQAYSNFVSPAIGQFQNLRVQQAQVDNTKALTALHNMQSLTEIEKAGLTGAQKKTAQGSIFSNIELAKAQSTKAQEQVLQEVIKTKALSHKQSGLIAKQIAEIRNIKLTGTFQELKNESQKLAAELAKYKITPNDNAFFRLMAVALGHAANIVGKVIPEEYKKYIDELLN